MPGHVFISYSRRDRAYVADLKARLRQEGIPFWVDDELDYGDRWASTVQRQIDQAIVLLVVVTPAALDSAWVDRELSYAQELGLPVLPLLRRKVNSLRLANLQFEDVTDGRMPSPRFFERIDALVASTSAGASARRAPHTASHPPRRRRTRRFVGPINRTPTQLWSCRAPLVATAFLGFPAFLSERPDAPFLMAFGLAYALLCAVRGRRFTHAGSWAADVAMTVILAAVTFYLSGGAVDLMSGESSPWVLGPLPAAVLLCWFSVAAWATQTFRDRPH